MFSVLIFLILAVLFIGFIAAIPIALVKVARAKKYNCPNCENEFRFAANYGKCPYCRVKLYKHGDGTLHVRT